LREAMDFALNFFNEANQNNQLNSETHQKLVGYYREQRDLLDNGGALDVVTLRPREVCWSCRVRLGSTQPFCPACGVPVQGDRVERLRQLTFLCFEIKKHEKAGRLPLALAHQLLAEANGRVAALRSTLEQERAPLVEAAEKPAAAAPEPVLEAVAAAAGKPMSPPRPRRSLLEILLDPRSIQWLLASGGALLVLGLIIYLAAEGLFENKLFVAILLGVATRCFWPAAGP